MLGNKRNKIMIKKKKSNGMTLSLKTNLPKTPRWLKDRCLLKAKPKCSPLEFWDAAPKLNAESSPRNTQQRENKKAIRRVGKALNGSVHFLCH